MANTIDKPDINLQIFEELSSTNTYLIEQAEKDTSLASGTAAQALIQTAGRGRYNRHWLSQQGNLALSIYLKPHVPMSEQAQLAFIAGLAAIDTFIAAGINPESIKLKWPNDVLVNEQKICGILIEKAGEGLVLGFGANLVFAPEDSTALLAHTKQPISLDAFRDSFLENLSSYYAQWQEKGFAVIAPQWLKHSWRLNQEITVQLRNETFKGIFKKLDNDGALVVEDQSSGTLRRVTAGDVFHA